MMFVHRGNQLVAQQATLGPGRGAGYVWTHEPASGEIIGQITLTGTHTHHPTTITNTDADPGDVRNWDQDRVDAEFFALVADLAGAPHEIIDPSTGDVVGQSSQTLYGKRVWRGHQSSPLLFAGQYYDDESGWAYNRFRYYHPDAGVYNAQDPLGAAPRIASAQGYVNHPAHWVDIYGLKAHPLWSPREVLGKRVYQQNGTHVFDPFKEVYLPNSIGGGKGTNLDLMRAGRAPIGVDDNPVNLHHIGQDDRSALVEITAETHTKHRSTLHIYDGLSRKDFPVDVIPVDRESFNAWREQYWMERARDFE
ncbi:HNH/ENDO VII family nuclease [Corynebacterium cystitidis]|uniref:RHS repeat-associated core domain-containing protein n=1 Tax=Corynebacterium cystitidis DSM 20524 TaxID=1121357 RepID=A0A1H9WLI1_9CORY|nr:HNH/ENDO VII family nuclease [Corynebacterium cystitidis]WJY83430.1 putative deoxyribonuclease RhsA [Corynebacterium cystitidis DSM 20524]SES34313.1 RHS repeat-associated core domain-containing protein [Corynebacterium cystitidis DSM 20524]SNV61704.1 Uncharacterized conserved protein [Corynebacterium cystitidis]